MPRPVSRFGFLRGAFAGETAALRPPWALNDPAFRKSCDGCGDCAKVCATVDGASVIRIARDGLPIVNFNFGECTFCEKCVEVCAPRALRLYEDDGRTVRAPWAVRASIATKCLSLNAITCRVCGDRCDERAIRFRLAVGGVAFPEIDLAACTGCGACVAPCPVDAVTVEPIEIEERKETA